MSTDVGFVTFNLLFYDQDTSNDAYNLINEVPRTNKYLIEGEEDMNKVIILTRGGKAGKGNTTPEELRQQHMEKVLKEWGVNKGVWLTEMRIKQKIDKVRELKFIPATTKVAADQQPTTDDAVAGNAK